MNMIRTSIKKYKKILLFLGIIFLFAIASGMIFYIKQDAGIKKTIILNLGDIFSHNIFEIKNLFIHLCLSLIVIAASFVFLGIPIIILAIFFEGISIGFLIPIFFSLYKWKFLLPFCLFLLLTKLIYIILIAFLFINSCEFTKNYITYLKNKKLIFFSSLKKMFALSGLVIINDLCIYFLFNKLLIFLLG